MGAAFLGPPRDTAFGLPPPFHLRDSKTSGDASDLILTLTHTWGGRSPPRHVTEAQSKRGCSGADLSIAALLGYEVIKLPLLIQVPEGASQNFVQVR